MQTLINGLRLARPVSAETPAGVDGEGPHRGVRRASAKQAEAPDASGQVSLFIDGLVGGRTGMAVLPTAAAVEELARVAESLGRKFGLVAGLRRAVKVCGGPEAASALRKLGLDADITAPRPYTLAEMAATLSRIPLEGMNLAIVHHAKRDDALAAAVEFRCGSVDELFLAPEGGRKPAQLAV